MKHHLKHMAIGGAVVLAVLLALRVDFGTALRYAALLACPLGMIAMMVFMGRRGGHHHGEQPAPTDTTTSPVPGVQRVSVHDLPTPRPSQERADPLR